MTARSRSLALLGGLLLACSTESSPQDGGSLGGGIDSIDGGGTGGPAATSTAQGEGEGAADGDGRGTTGDELEGDAGPGSEGDGGSTGADAGESASPTGSTGDEAAPVCETVLCGASQTCCGTDQDCVLGACVAACETGVRCGEAQQTCCGAQQVCLANACTDPGTACLDSFDCPQGEFCEPTLGACLPQSEPVACELVPAFEDLTVTEEWTYELDEIISIPVVADIDGDSDPEVVLNLTQQVDDWVDGRLLVLNGRTGVVEWPTEPNPPALYNTQGRSTVGLADVNGDTLPDIIFAGREVNDRSVIWAVDGLGNELWFSHDSNGDPYGFDVVNGAPSFGNFDADPESEIVFGATLIDNDGLVVWDQSAGGAGSRFGSPNNYVGGISAIANLDSDPEPEIVSGRDAWEATWVDNNGTPEVTVVNKWTSPGDDGYPAIADIDLNGTPEVVLVAGGRVRIIDGESGLLWCGIDPTGAACEGDDNLRTQPVDIPGGGRGGPPTIADFDGDGRPEIAAAGGASYTVYDLAREGEDIVVPDGDPQPSAGAIYERWSRTTQDQSSNATGSSVFDFQGDGAAEVVYADECFLRVYDGASGVDLLETENTSATIHEYPLVVDVDDDGNSEILIVANDTNSESNCPGNQTARRGLFVYGDAFDQWVGTRRVWPSHTYHVTNATSAGTTPAVELDNWTQPGLNNYRQNVQGEGVFNAPDLAVELVAELGGCFRNELGILATVRNEGSLGVAAGVPVSLYRGSDIEGELVSTQTTARALLPGQQTELRWTIDFTPGGDAIELFVAVDGEQASGGQIAECDETNNDDRSTTASCPSPG